MKLVSACCMIFPLLMPLNSQAGKIPPNQKSQSLKYVIGDIYQNPRQLKAFFLDTVLWPYNTTTKTYPISVCWENSSQSTATEKQLVTSALASTWESNSLVDFIWGGACQATSKGIRIKVIDNSHSPRAALGMEGDGKIGVMLMNFDMATPVFGFDLSTMTLLQRCARDNSANLATCIQSSAIHEFGHVLGLAHEQNRKDDPIIPPRGLCTKDDPNPYTPPGNVGTFTMFGNTWFTDYDPNSMMNYCRNAFFGRIDLSPLDKLALRVYYGQMPSFDIRTRILKIPRIIRYDGKIFTGSFNLLADGIRFQKSASLVATTTPSKSPATLSQSGVLLIPELKYISTSGRINQILNARLQETTTPGIYARSWSRVQPTQFTPIPISLYTSVKIG